MGAEASGAVPAAGGLREGLVGVSQESELWVIPVPVTVTSVVGFKSGKGSKATRKGQVDVEYLFSVLFFLLKTHDRVTGISQLVEPSSMRHRLTKFLFIPGIINSGAFQGRESPS